MTSRDVRSHRQTFQPLESQGDDAVGVVNPFHTDSIQRQTPPHGSWISNDGRNNADQTCVVSPTTIICYLWMAA
jgi:hypothetical protein